MPEEDATGTTSLVVGSRMHCPRCEKLQSVLAYRPLRMTDKFVSELSPILKCPSCGWLFSPGFSEEELHSIVEQWMAEMTPSEAPAKVRELVKAVA